MNNYASVFCSDYYCRLSFDGTKYILFDNNDFDWYNSENNKKEYKVGQIISELSRIDNPNKCLYEAIIHCRGYKKPLENEFVKEIFQELYEVLKYKYGEIYSMLSTVMLYIGIKAQLEEFDNCWVEDIEFMPSSKKDEIMYKEPINCVGNLLLESYYYHSRIKSQFDDFDRAMYCLEKTEGELNNDPRLIKKLFYDYFYEKDIGFSIELVDGRLFKCFEFKDFMSLIVFDYANVLDNDIIIKRCKNCGKLFPLYGRKDVMYCYYPAPNFEGKTCRDIGAQITRTKKEKNDDFTNEYRKLYMRIKMQLRRHEEDDDLNDYLDKFVLEGKKWRKKISYDKKNELEALKWLNKQDRKMFGNRSKIFSPEEALQRVRIKCYKGECFELRDLYENNEWDRLTRGEKISFGRYFFNYINMIKKDVVRHIEGTGHDGIPARYEVL